MSYLLSFSVTLVFLYDTPYLPYRIKMKQSQVKFLSVVISFSIIIRAGECVSHDIFREIFNHTIVKTSLIFSEASPCYRDFKIFWQGVLTDEKSCLKGKS